MDSERSWEIRRVDYLVCAKCILDIARLVARDGRGRRDVHRLRREELTAAAPSNVRKAESVVVQVLLLLLLTLVLTLARRLRWQHRFRFQNIHARRQNTEDRKQKTENRK